MYVIVGALLGHNLTDVTAMTSQFDVYVRKSSLNAFTSEYVRHSFLLFMGLFFNFFYSTAHH